MALITGNTYPVKDRLKALGGRWDAARKGWIVPDDKAEEANALVAPGLAAGKRTAAPVRRGPRTCKTCGCRINYGAYCGKCEYS